TVTPAGRVMVTPTPEILVPAGRVPDIATFKVALVDFWLLGEGLSYVLLLPPPHEARTISSDKKYAIVFSLLIILRFPFLSPVKDPDTTAQYQYNVGNVQHPVAKRCPTWAERRDIISDFIFRSKRSQVVNRPERVDCIAQARFGSFGAGALDAIYAQ